MADNAGIDRALCKVYNVHGKHRAFFTKRFDREGNKRIHFASAMTMTGKTEQIIDKIMESVSHWQSIAKNISIPKKEQDLMSSAFNYL